MLPDCLRYSRKAFAAVTAAALMALAACDGGHDAAPAARMDTSVAGVVESQPRPSLKIGPEGAMALKEATAFSVDALAASFPGLELVAGNTVIDRQVFPVIQARADGMTLFEVFAGPGGRVGRVVTRSPAVAGPQDDVIGSTRLRDLPPNDVTHCVAEMVAGERRQVCEPTPGSRFVRVFRPAQNMALPRRGVAGLEVLAGGDILLEMRWTPPPSAP